MRWKLRVREPGSPGSPARARCMHACMYVSMYLCIYVSMYLCVYVCMCVYIYIYIYTHASLLKFYVYNSLYLCTSRLMKSEAACRGSSLGWQVFANPFRCWREIPTVSLCMWLWDLTLGGSKSAILSAPACFRNAAERREIAM